MKKPDHSLLPVKNPTLKQIYRIIYFADTPAGKIFDIVLLVLILLSSAMVMMQTVKELDVRYHPFFVTLEVTITIIFAIEYILRIVTVRNKKAYIFSALGILDFLSIVPFFISLFFPVVHIFVIVRTLRLLRIFRIFNLADYMNDGAYIVRALKGSLRKIYIFLLFLCIFIIIIGSIMYVVEGGENGFNSIPLSIYWAVVTITTVGYGDISPITPLGKFISIIVMLAGYSIIAVPTGIVTSELRNLRNKMPSCTRCGKNKHDNDARYCNHCGERLVIEEDHHLK
ncbi:ion transporter [Bergeyella zoohelcum]|uniref:Ion transport domain-containing protein n=1 Tax=Bergeyella zoohelcum ATCC 43767 TaxID=883096 RepID=K1LQ70_9FLAO|nr:ion transporter [Bergeyella zoohelcum]EKB54232.1 hypothetical protein HMPREF9699_02044 [Bergeyella zoohelcum ATCC 43767]SUV49881.1 Voltage-gated potassium channel [Bergeyella zoohelcum]